jgi:monoamine oxidase
VRIGIVGLGAAGIYAAHLLEREGVELELFEARDRIGGRLHTIDKGGGAVFEAGGEWIDADHHRMLGLLKDFGLTPEIPTVWPAKLRYRGQETSEALVWNDALEDDLRVEAAARDLCRTLGHPPWTGELAEELDHQTMARFVDEYALSPRGRWWVEAKLRSDEGDDLDRIGVLGWLNGFTHYLGREGDVMSAYRVPGGFSGLFEKMLRGVGREPRFDHRLRRVSQDQHGVRLQFDEDEVRVDRAILTLPPPALERVVFEPPLESVTRCAIEACRMSRAVKIHWEFDRPWWHEREWGGRMLCDGPVQQTWDGSLGDAPILTAYICGRKAAEWAELADPVAAGVYELSQMFPEAKDGFRRGWFQDWIADPYALGAFSHTAPGYLMEHAPNIAGPEGRVHFAGEHTASWTGFVEGALQSAERVAAEVMR